MLYFVTVSFDLTVSSYGIPQDIYNKTMTEIYNEFNKIGLSHINRMDNGVERALPSGIVIGVFEGNDKFRIRDEIFEKALKIRRKIAAFNRLFVTVGEETITYFKD